MDIYGHEIIIEHPAMVFGDGQHETTQHLLALLNRYGASGKSYIDVGSGTGILSIFASKLGMTVTAIDCDGYAIECTHDNIIRNGAENIEVVSGAVERINDMTADIVTGNFGMEMGIYFAPILSRFVNKDGILLMTWYKDLDKIPTDELPKWEVIDKISGEDYDAYALRRKA